MPGYLPEGEHSDLGLHLARGLLLAGVLREGDQQDDINACISNGLARFINEECRADDLTHFELEFWWCDDLMKAAETHGDETQRFDINVHEIHFRGEGPIGFFGFSHDAYDDLPATMARTAVELLEGWLKGSGFAIFELASHALAWTVSAFTVRDGYDRLCETWECERDYMLEYDTDNTLMELAERGIEPTDEQLEEVSGKMSPGTYKKLHPRALLDKIPSEEWRQRKVQSALARLRKQEKASGPYLSNQKTHNVECNPLWLRRVLDNAHEIQESMDVLRAVVREHKPRDVDYHLAVRPVFSCALDWGNFEGEATPLNRVLDDELQQMSEMAGGGVTSFVWTAVFRTRDAQSVADAVAYTRATLRVMHALDELLRCLDPNLTPEPELVENSRGQDLRVRVR